MLMKQAESVMYYALADRREKLSVFGHAGSPDSVLHWKTN
jgi:hypothetical protein